MKVFITGGAGFVGSHMAARLVREGHTVTCYDNLSLGKREYLAGLVAEGACALVEADLLDRGRVVEAMAGHDLVIHLAANSDIFRLYVCRRDLVRHIPADRPTDFARDIFPDRLTSGAPLYAYCSDEYVHDLGTVERYTRVVADAKRMIERHEGALFRG